MAVPILKMWKNYFENPDEGMGSSYERIMLNQKLFSVAKLFKVKKILEVPIFGFTGLSGINSLGLALKNYDVTLIDHDLERIDLVKNVWEKFDLSPEILFSEDYDKLDFKDRNFDMSWNFSALWFVKNLESFLSELTRVTDKVIFLSVPNRAGIGYLTQKYSGREDMKKYLIEENIIPQNIKKIMKELGWFLIDHKFIDCPPWPDIGMAKEDFLEKFHLGFLNRFFPKKEGKDILSILNYYQGKEPEFEKNMLKLSELEKRAPYIFKKFWSHHQYMIFIRGN